MNLLKDDGMLAIATKGGEDVLISVKDLKRSGRGSYDYVVEANSGLTIVRWFDNSEVH